jgi:hypothetical protein
MMKKAEIKKPVDKARGYLDDYAEKPTVRKHASGRPSKYDPEYHPAKLVELCEGGLSFAACAGEFRIARETIYDWTDKFPEFSDAKRTAESLALLFWERQNIKLAQTGEGNATATVFGLKNRSRKGERRVPDWQDVSKQEISGSLEITRIVVEVVDPKAVS